MTWGAEWHLLCRDYSDKEVGRNPREKAESPGLCREKTTVSQGMEEENWIGKETPPGSWSKPGAFNGVVMELDTR